MKSRLLFSVGVLASIAVLSLSNLSAQDDLATSPIPQPEAPTVPTTGLAHKGHITVPVLSTLFEEQFLAENVNAARSKMAKMSEEEKFNFLESWVLPSRLRSSIRMNGAFTQTEPSEMAFDRSLKGSPRGGELVSPVFDLLEVAKKLGKLDELRQDFINISPSSMEDQQRAKAALLSLVNLEIGDQSAASEATDELYHLVRKTVPDSLGEMWPETLVVYRGSMEDELNPDVAELLSHIDSNRTARSIPSGLTEWHAHISTLMHRQQFANDIRGKKLDDSTDLLQDWIPVGRAFARYRGTGASNAEWTRKDQEVRHRSSHDHDYLFYQSPLRGNFEFEGDVVGYGKTQIFAGGKFYGATHVVKQLETGTFREGRSVQEMNPPFTRFNPWVHFRVVFRDGVCSKYINGRLVLTEELPEDYDPWIGFHCWYKNDGGFRNVQISGTPEIPQSVAMSESSEMIGWISYFGQSVGRKTGRWQFFENPDGGNEIRGLHARGSLIGTFYESLLKYHRPLVEDGSIDYEFYYEPGETHTHPALDRLAFMLEPTGVRIHSITDREYDQTDVSPENMFDEPQNRRGPAQLPLKENNWNHMSLRLEGNTVLLQLNGQLIFQRELAATNRRTFGLFHFPGQTEVRVRNVLMRGDWPQTIPAASDQKIADPLVVKLDADSTNLKAEFTHNFNKDGLPTHLFKHHDNDKRGTLRATSAGVSIIRPGTGGWTTTDLRLPFNVFGDFDIEVEFDQLQLVSNKDSCIMLIAQLDDENQTRLRNTRIHTAAQNDEMHPSLTALQVDGSRAYRSATAVTCEAKAGRLRLARRGKTVYYLLAENDSEAYRIIGTEELSDEPIRSDGVQLRTLCHGDGVAKVVWKNVTVRAERLTYLPSDAPVETKSLYTMNSDGTELQLVTKVPEGFTQFGSPEWSADGKQITFDASQGGTGTSHVMVINADGANLRDLGMGCMPSFSGDGKRMVFSQPGYGVVMMNSDGTGRETIERSAWGVQWSPDGKNIAYSKSGNITITDPDTRESRLLFTGEQATRINYVYWNLGWSHDSRSICAKVRNRQTGGEELIVADINSPDGFKVLHSDLRGINPDFTWGPENKNVLFAMSNPHHKGPQLYLSNRANPAAPELLPGQPLDQKIYDCAWSPDGKRIVFSGQKFPQAVEWPPIETKPSTIPSVEP